MALPGNSLATVAPRPRAKPRVPSVFNKCCKHCLGPLYRWLISLPPICIRHCTVLCVGLGYNTYYARQPRGKFYLVCLGKERVTLISSKGASTKLRTTPARPAAIGTAYVKLGSSPGVCKCQHATQHHMYLLSASLHQDGQSLPKAERRHETDCTLTVSRAREYVYTCR